jgi:hypothetical protein
MRSLSRRLHVESIILETGNFRVTALPVVEIIQNPEHKAVGMFSPEEIPALRMPEGYKKSISAWLAYLERSNT